MYDYLDGTDRQWLFSILLALTFAFFTEESVASLETVTTTWATKLDGKHIGEDYHHRRRRSKKGLLPLWYVLYIQCYSTPSCTSYHSTDTGNGGFIVDGVMWIYVFCVQMVNLMTSPSHSYGILFYYVHEANSGWRSAELASARDGEIHFLQYSDNQKSGQDIEIGIYKSGWWSRVQKDNKDQFPSSSLDLSFCFWQGGLTPGYPIYYRVIVIAKSFDFSLTFLVGRSSAPSRSTVKAQFMVIILL